MISRRTFWFIVATLVSLIALGLTIWWWCEKKDRSAVPAFVASLASLIWCFYNANWSELFTRHTSPEEAKQIEHDTALFNKIDAILPEWLVIEIDENVAGRQLRWYRDIAPGDDLAALLQQEGNQFIDPPLRSLALAFNSAVQELNHYTGKHFFNTAKDLFRLYPTLQEKLEIGDQEAWQRWEKYTEKLSELCREMRGTYSEFRRAVKAKLLR